MIRLDSVSKGYHGSALVLDSLQLTVERGEFLYVVGGSGAGKTSLLRMLATEEMPSNGALSLLGVPLARMSASSLRALRQSIGFIPQDSRLVPELSALDNIRMGLLFAPRKARGPAGEKRIADLVESLGLSAARNKPARTLSGGEAQRVAVARALVRMPELILADEPTGAQDRDQTWAIMDLLSRENQRGATVLVATHDREIIRRVRKRCAHLQAGRLVSEEPGCYF